MRRRFIADNPSEAGYYRVTVDIYPLSPRSSASSWIQSQDCVWRGTDDNKPIVNAEVSVTVVGDGARACHFGFTDGSRLFVYSTGTRNVGLFLQTAPSSLSVTNANAIDFLASMASPQLALIDRASPPGVTSTARTFKGAAAFLDGAIFPTANPPTGIVSYKGAEGKLVSVFAFQGQVEIWVPLGKTADAPEIQAAAAIFGGKIIGQVPSIGLYVAQVAPGKEGGFIDGMRQIGLEAWPTLAISFQTELVDAAMPRPVVIDAPQVQLDDFKTPLCVKNCNELPDKRLYLALPPGPGFPYYTTSDPSKALTHGLLVQYLRLGRVQDTPEPTLSMDIANPIGLTETIGVFQDWNSVYTNLRLVFGAADDTLTTTVNLSLGPSCSNQPTCNPQANNQLFLTSLERLIKVSNAGDKILLVVSAGNDSANVSMPPSVTNDPAWSSIIRVGALYLNATELNPVSNYSIDDDILYVPVNHAMIGLTGVEECVPCLGTSFAAPQIDYLVGEIARNRIDLTPAELKQVLFDPELSPRKTVDGPRGLKLQVRVLNDPYDAATLQAALKIAQRLFPVAKEPQLPGQQQDQQGKQFTPLGQRTFGLPLQFNGAAQLPNADAGKYYDYWFCKDPPASPAFFCGVNATADPVGGHPPYHFQHGPLGGFPPFGLILNTNGHLAGNINRAAGRSTPYTFTVCVLDLDGKSVCLPTSLLVRPAPAPAPTPTPTPTPTPLPPATLTVSPSSAAAGAVVTVTGQGFTPNGTMTSLTVAGIQRSPPTGLPIQADGTFRTNIFVPTPLDAGPATLTSRDNSGRTASATITVTPLTTLTVSPSSAAAGSQVTASGQGFTANSRVTVAFGGAPVSIAFSDSSGAFTIAFFLASPLSGGSYIVSATDDGARTANATLVVAAPPPPPSTPLAFAITSASCRFLRGTGSDREYERLASGTASGPVGARLVLPGLPGYISRSWTNSWGTRNEQIVDRLPGDPATTTWTVRHVGGSSPWTVDGYIRDDTNRVSDSRVVTCQ